MKKTLKIIVAVTLITALGLAMIGCGQKTNISMYDLQKAIVSSDSTLEDYKTVNKSGDSSGELFAYVSDMDYSKVDDYFLIYPEMAENNSDEILVVSLKNSSDVSQCKKSIEAHTQSRKEMYQAYSPEMVDSLDNALLFERDNFVVLIVHKNQEDIKNTFEEFLKNNK